jgi:hypothetical protein
MPLPSDNAKGRVRSVALELFRDLGTIYFTRLQATNAWCVRTGMERCVLHVADERWEFNLM